MMRPHFCAFMPGIAARIAWNGRGKIDGDDGVPLVGRKVLDRRDMLDAGVVDEDVDRTHLGFGVGDHRLDFGALGHVGRVVESLDPELLLDFDALGLDRRLVAEAVDDDIRAFLGERAGDRQPNAARRTGDKGMTFGERHRRFSCMGQWRTVLRRSVILHCDGACEGSVALQQPWMTNSPLSA